MRGSYENSPEIPQAGQLVRVRGRRAVVVSVTSEKSDSMEENSKNLHLVEVEYLDQSFGSREETILWEREIDRQIYTNLEMPPVREANPTNIGFMNSFINAVRWTTIGYNMLSENDKKLSIVSPWKSAVKIEDYQLLPVYTALKQNRVKLLIADGVGLGKTIEAGLIMQELIAQRGVKRILVICPSALQSQWQEELREKFQLNFTIVNSQTRNHLQRKYGFDYNPWRSIARIITSMDYLRQEDVKNSFIFAARSREKSSRRAWDLLIVDEAHNFAPRNLTASNSLRTMMLREVSAFCSHRIFLTATPHNGFTSSFTGLLEILDPLNFHQTTEIPKDSHMAKQIPKSVIRRIKSEIKDPNGNNYFTERKSEIIRLEYGPDEIKLFELLDEYLDILKNKDQNEDYGRITGYLVTFFKKRLLSSGWAFSISWKMHTLPTEIDYEITYDEARRQIKNALQKELTDEEKERLEKNALKSASTVIRPKTASEDVVQIHERINKQLARLGYSGNQFQKINDEKFNALVNWLNSKVVEKEDERVIIFTEYVDTLEYLQNRLISEDKRLEELIATIHGGTSASERERIIKAFNAKDTRERILIASDTAAEGMNLQFFCRYLINYDIPWNPSKIEQRIGRVDRHGQSRDVYVYHFASDQNDDLKFLNKIAQKVASIRDDLGKTGEILESLILRHLYLRDYQQTTLDEFEFESDPVKDMTPKEFNIKNTTSASMSFIETNRYFNLYPETMKEVFLHALKFVGGDAREEANGLIVTKFGKWEKIFNQLFHKTNKVLVFDHNELLVEENNRKVFRKSDTKELLTLGHPLMERALITMRSFIWDTDTALTRWYLVIDSKADQNVLKINVLLIFRNNLSEIIHASLESLEFKIDLKRRLLEFRGPSDNPNLGNEEEKIQLHQGLISDIRKFWVSNSSKIEENIGLHAEKLTQKIQEKIEKQKMEELNREKQILAEKLDELRNRSIYSNILRKQFEHEKKILETLQTSSIDMYFDPEEHKRQIMLQEKKIRQLEEEIDHFFQTGYNEYIKSVEKHAKQESEFMQNHIIPNRYTIRSKEIYAVTAGFHLADEMEVKL